MRLKIILIRIESEDHNRAEEGWLQLKKEKISFEN